MHILIVAAISDLTTPALLLVLAAAAVIALDIRFRSRGRRVARADAGRARIAWLGTYTEAFQRSIDVLTDLGARLTDADPNRGEIVARTSRAALGMRSTVRITLRTEEGVTYVQLDLKPPAPPLDWGNSRRFVESFIRAWERLPAPVKR